MADNYVTLDKPHDLTKIMTPALIFYEPVGLFLSEATIFFCLLSAQF